jgi:hypothetical protein
MTGRAFDRGCRFPGQNSIARDGRVTQIGVAVALRVRGGCRFLNSAGRLGSRRSCASHVFLPARLLNTRNGYVNWTFRKAARRLPRGSYQITSRARDASRNFERYSHPGRLVGRFLR